MSKSCGTEEDKSGGTGKDTRLLGWQGIRLCYLEVAGSRDMAATQLRLHTWRSWDQGKGSCVQAAPCRDRARGAESQPQNWGSTRGFCRDLHFPGYCSLHRQGQAGRLLPGPFHCFWLAAGSRHRIAHSRRQLSMAPSQGSFWRILVCKGAHWLDSAPEREA